MLTCFTSLTICIHFFVGIKLANALLMFDATYFTASMDASFFLPTWILQCFSKWKKVYKRLIIAKCVRPKNLCWILTSKIVLRIYMIHLHAFATFDIWYRKSMQEIIPWKKCYRSRDLADYCFSKLKEYAFTKQSWKFFLFVGQTQYLFEGSNFFVNIHRWATSCFDCKFISFQKKND